MTQEEKAKRYDETLEQLRGLIEGTREDKCAIVEEDIINIFPELKESEEGKIRKKLITFFQRFPYTNLYDVSINAKDVFAWLEKQENRNTNLCQEGVATKGYAVTEPEKYFREASAPIEATEAAYTSEVETGDGGIKALVTKKVVMPKFKIGDWVVNTH